MGILDALLGNTAADAAKAAAADTYKKQQEAVANLKGFGQDYANNFAGLAANYAPYQQTGAAGNAALQRLVADPSSVRDLPGYQFAFSEGTNALDRSAAARGMLNSGRQMKDLTRFGTGLADQTYGNEFNRLLGLTQQGQNATTAANTFQGQGYQGQLGANTTAYGGQFGSAGTIGQGDVAAANAQASGLQGLLSAGMNLGGMALGGGFNPMSLFSGGAKTTYGSGK